MRAHEELRFAVGGVGHLYSVMGVRLELQGVGRGLVALDELPRRGHVLGEIPYTGSSAPVDLSVFEDPVQALKRLIDLDDARRQFRAHLARLQSGYRGVEGNVLRMDLPRARMAELDRLFEQIDASLRRILSNGLAAPLDTLQGIRVSTLNLDGIDLRGRDLSGAQFEGCSLRGADFREASLSYAQIRVCDMTNAKMNSVNLVEAQIDRCRLIGTELQRADLARARIRTEDLTLRQLDASRWTSETEWPAELRAEIVENSVPQGDGSYRVEASAQGPERVRV